jgi:serine/threonine-protein kinase
LSSATLIAGRYRLERSLGHGGMAVVELAHDVELDRIVAVKLLADNLVRDDAFRRRFLREARLSAGLAHPNIVRIFDTGKDGDRPYIVMEYVDGETLEAMLRRVRTLDPPRAVDLMIQACAGLDAAHAAGLVHRDIKPQNLLVGADGVLKIVDFGIARYDDGQGMTATGTVLGTAAYLAPEQAAGESVTAAADIYALGAVLYELLTGRPPRQIESLAELVPHVDDAITPVRELAPETPRELELVVMRCLARYPQYRPASAAELAHDLAEASPEAATRPLPATTGVRATEVMPRKHRTGRKRAAWIVLAAAAAAAVLAVVLVATQSSGTPAKPPVPAQVASVPTSADPAQQARNLSAWLRKYSR